MASSSTGLHTISRIADKASSAIQSALGTPTGPARTLADGVTTYQQYTKCAFFSNPAYGTIIVASSVDAKWQQCANLTTAAGEKVQDYLGAPVQDPVILKGGAIAVYFERGMITVRPDKGAFVTYGDIYLRYRGFSDVTGVLGLPVSDEEPVGAGRRSRFDFGEICFKSGIGAFEVHGAIRDRYEALGGPATFGFPMTNESSVMLNGKEIGRYNNFENGGSIYWSGASGAWDVYGAIKAEWDTLGGAVGPLGFPTSGETDTPLAHAPGPDAGGRYNNFQNGVIVWHASGPYAGANPVLNLHFYVDSFNSSFDNIHVQAKVQSSYGQGFDNWIPSSDSYASNPRVQRDLIPLIPAVHSDLSISVWFDGLGDHSIGQDERLGIYQATLNISNLWGLRDGPAHPPNQNANSSYSFSCNFRTQTDVPVPPGTPWRKQFWWPFDNFSTPSLSWQQYAETYTDVHDQESVIWHPFDHLFYTLAYQGVCANGNCFGMCLESIYAQNHRSIYGEPLYSDPYNGYTAALLGGAKPGAGDGTLTNDINIKHGYQIGAESINYFLGKFVSGETHDPVKTFQESLASFQAGDTPLISISKDYFFGGGHCIRPYEWNSQTKPWTIKVANPNTPASTSPDDNAAANVIKIDPVANTFSIDESPGTTYTGGSSSGGRMFSIPYSVLSSPPVTPFSDVLALLTTGAIIVMGGDGQTKQITDQAGKTYLTAQGAINEDPATRIPDFCPIPLLHGSMTEVNLAASGVKRLEPSLPPELYYMQGSPLHPLKLATKPVPAAGSVVKPPLILGGRPLVATPFREVQSVQTASVNKVGALFATPALHHEVVSPGGSAYQWAMRTASMSVVVEAPGSSASHSDFIAIDNPGRPRQAVSISVAQGAPGKTASVQVVGPLMAGSANARLYEISNLPVNDQQGISLSLDEGGQELLLHNAGPQVSVSLRVQSGPLAANSASRAAVALEAGALHSISPADWTPAAIATTQLSLKVLDKPGGTILKQTTI